MSQNSFDMWNVKNLSNARNGSSKSDSYSHGTGNGLDAGNQRVTLGVNHYTEHLPGSPAGGAPTHEREFGAGHQWTEASGKVHEGVGPGNSRW